VANGSFCFLFFGPEKESNPGPWILGPTEIACATNWAISAFPWGSAFLLGETHVLFLWLLWAVCFAHGLSTMRMVRLMSSDGAENLYKAIDAFQDSSTGVISGGRARCFWHLFYQFYLKTVSSGGASSEDGFHDVITATVRTVIKKSESDAEALSGWTALETFIRAIVGICVLA
jgi:hypothetical protein